MQPARNIVELGSRFESEAPNPGHCVHRCAQRKPSREQRAAWGEAELLERLLHGEDAAWDEFVSRYHLLINSCIERVTRAFRRSVSSADREDIYAQLLCSLHARDMHRLRAFQFERGIRLSTWVGLLARHSAWDYLRRLPRARQSAAWYDHQQEFEPDNEDPARIFERKEHVAFAVSALEQLSARDRSFVELFYVDRLAPEAIARTMGISVKTVYTKKHKLQHRLREQVAIQESGSL